MARSAASDPIEKFRFRVFVLDSTIADVSNVVTGLLSGITGVSIPADQLGTFLGTKSVLSRSGFNEIELPKATITEFTYRENISAFRFDKFAGLTRFEPLVLRRGVTNNSDLYEWYNLVNNDATVDSQTATLTGGIAALTQDHSTPPVNSINYRRDVVIQVLNRESNPIKEWRIFNAWPSSYKPGNDLSASTEEKLIEELTLIYEFFTEQNSEFFSG